MNKVRGQDAIQPHAGISATLIKALDHPLRRELLRKLSDGEEWSPSALTKVVPSRFDLSTVTYHVKVLAKFDAVGFTRDRPVRGFKEHFYVSYVADSEHVAAVLRTTEEEDQRLLSRL